MKKELKQEIKKYLKDIKALMPGDGSSKRKYLHGLKEEIFDFTAENTSATFYDVLLNFGEKEEVAKQYMDTLDVKDVKRKLSVKKAVIAVLVIALVVWGAAVFLGAQMSRTDSVDGYFLIEQSNNERGN